MWRGGLPCPHKLVAGFSTVGDAHPCGTRGRSPFQVTSSTPRASAGVWSRRRPAYTRRLHGPARLRSFVADAVAVTGDGFTAGAGTGLGDTVGREDACVGVGDVAATVLALRHTPATSPRGYSLSAATGSARWPFPEESWWESDGVPDTPRALNGVSSQKLRGGSRNTACFGEPGDSAGLVADAWVTPPSV